MSIVIADYDPLWALQFEELKTVYCALLGSWIQDVQHVGSTAVPGLAAKPVLDIDLIIETGQHLPAIIEQLEQIGYQFMGEMGITDRYAFKQLSSDVPIVGSGTQWPKHHLYVCLQESIALRNHLTLRYALRSNPGLAAQYGQLKRSLADRCTNMDQYVKEKTTFILSVLQAAGLQASALQSIEKDNLGE